MQLESEREELTVDKSILSQEITELKGKLAKQTLEA